MGRGIGEIQKRILEEMNKNPRRVYDAEELAKRLFGEKAFIEGWRKKYLRTKYQATIARALKSLERRGLIVRLKRGSYMSLNDKRLVKTEIAFRLKLLNSKIEELQREYERLYEIYLQLEKAERIEETIKEALSD
jgi:hypothetical protein